MQKTMANTWIQMYNENSACQAYIQYLSLSLRLTLQFNKHKTGMKIMDIEHEFSCKLGDTANK